MAILRPRRGTAPDAISQVIILQRGEVFFQVPQSGYNSGVIVMGKGSTTYSSLSPFITYPDAIKIGFTNSSSATNKSNNSTYLNNIIPSNTLQTIFTNLKQLLVNFNSQLNNCIYPNETNVCGPSFELHIGSGTLMIPATTPSNPVIGSIWIS